MRTDTLAWLETMARTKEPDVLTLSSHTELVPLVRAVADSTGVSAASDWHIFSPLLLYANIKCRITPEVCKDTARSSSCLISQDVYADFDSMRPPNSISLHLKISLRCTDESHRK